MDQLTTLDAGFLKAEDADRHVSLAIGGLAVIEGPIPARDALMATLAERIRLCPRFDSAYARVPSTSVHPYGWTTRTLISVVTCGTSPYRGPATTESCCSWPPT